MEKTNAALRQDSSQLQNHNCTRAEKICGCTFRLQALWETSCEDTESLMIEAIGVSTDDSYLSRNPLTPHMFTQLYGSKTF